MKIRQVSIEKDNRIPVSEMPIGTIFHSSGKVYWYIRTSDGAIDLQNGVSIKTFSLPYEVVPPGNVLEITV